MMITAPCPSCRGIVDLEGPPFPEGFSCTLCKKVFQVPTSAALAKGDPPDRCLFCGDTEFYVEKDMPRGLGLGLVLIAAILVPWTFGISIIAIAFLQIPFFLMLPMRYVCYGCQTLYRGFPHGAHWKPFDHELATQRELARERAERKALETAAGPRA